MDVSKLNNIFTDVPFKYCKHFDTHGVLHLNDDIGFLSYAFPWDRNDSWKGLWLSHGRKGVLKKTDWEKGNMFMLKFGFDTYDLDQFHRKVS